jgi:Domain of unknown function (DUF6316)
MTKKRHQETHDLPQRIQRTYSINNAWYFELRGGGQKGPYDSEDEMQAALEEYIQLHHEVSDKI